MHFSIYQDTRIGPRTTNQDRIGHRYTKHAALLVVADGMGGHRYGEIAAQIAVNTLLEQFDLAAKAPLADPDMFLEKNIRHIHQAIHEVSIAKNLIETPRTTLVAAIVQANKLHYAHVGDSRLYHFRAGKINRKTTDHSVVELLHKHKIINKDQMASHPEKHKIFNCLGSDRPPHIELGIPANLRYGDLVMLCTDGVWGTMSDVEISNILHTGEIEIGRLARDLIDECEKRNHNNQGDNMSAVVLEWGQRANNLMAVSTVSMTVSHHSTQMSNHALPAAQSEDLTDSDIENAIAEIQEALKRTNRSEKG